MKKTSTVILIFVLLLSFALFGCSKKVPIEAAPPLVVAPVTPTIIPPVTPDPKPEKEEDEIKAINATDLWKKLLGYWTRSDDVFVYFSFEDGLPKFFNGIWNAGYLRGFADPMEALVLGETKYQIELYYPAEPENEMNEALDELYMTIVIDLGPEGDGKISVADSTGTWDYSYSGATIDEAYNNLWPSDFSSGE